MANVKEVCHGVPDYASERFRRAEASRFGQGFARSRSTSPSFVLGGDLRRWLARWARRGTRPRAPPHDQRTRSAYIFGAICPSEGKGAGLVLPCCNTEAMTLHLREISRSVKLNAHAVVLLDQAGWHGSKELEVPDNMTLFPLPPRSPELNPVENVWQFIRDNWLSNRVFKSYDDILDPCCYAWNNLIEQPWKIISIGTRQWAHE